MVRALGVIISSTVLLYFSIFPGLQNVVCGTPHETVIALDPNYRYYPFFVKLHRCAGSGHVSPFLRHCVPKSSGYEELNIEVYTKESNFKKVATILVKNHTSCVHECKAKADCNCSVEDWDDDTCTCKCRYPGEPPKELACKAGFRWMSNMFVVQRKKRNYKAKTHNWARLFKAGLATQDKHQFLIHC